MERKRQPCPMQYANKVSWIFFWWLNPLFSIGYQRNLEMSDVYDVLNEDSSNVLFNRLNSEWQKQLIKKQQGFIPSLRRAMWNAFGKEFLYYGLILFTEETMKVVQPILLGGLIRYFTGGGVSLLHAYFYAAGVSLCAIAIALSHHPYFFLVTRMGMWLRIASCSLIYQKSLCLSNRALGKTTTGQIVNLLSNDVGRFDQLTLFLHYLWIGPLQAIVVIVLLWQEVGWACLAGFILLLLLIPLQACMGKLFSKLRRRVAGLTDERVRIMNEILTGIRVIKMYCWEHMFADLVKNVRRKEAATIMQAAMAKSVMNAIMISTCHVLMLSVVSVLVLLGQPLHAASLFKMMSYFIQIELTLVLFVPFAIQGLAEISVTLGRIQEFLLLDELDHVVSGSHKPWAQTLLESRVTADSVTAIWNKELSSDTLRDVSIDVRPGELVAVIGPVGAGKSSLLMALLHELPVSRGTVSMGGSVAYSAQQPWVFSATVQQNILFGQPFDKEKYERALRATALARDIEILPEGDQTLVGERGASLSGGQKARIGLARAVYANADIYLLDDPLSAVDTAVGRHIFDRCICGILRTKACVLVTHQLQYLKKVDRIIVLRQGRIVACGRYEQLINSGLNIALLLKQKSETQQDAGLARTASGRQVQPVLRQGSRIPEEDLPVDSVVQNNKIVRQCSSDSDAGASTTDNVTFTQSVCANGNTYDYECNVKTTEKDTLSDREVQLTSHPLLSRSVTLLPKVEPLESGVFQRRHSQSGLPMSRRTSVDRTSSVWSLGADLNFEVDFVAPVEKEEARQEGTVSVRLYWTYLKRGIGIAGMIVFVLLNLLAQTSYIISDWWLAYWTSADDERMKRLSEHDALVAAGYNHTNITIPDVPSNRNLWIYAFIVLSVFVFGLFRALFLFFAMLTSSRHMHNDMFASIVRSRMIFFDTNPIGRVLNRFSKDIGQMDEILPISMYDFVQCLLLVIGSVLVAGVVNPWVFIPTLPLTILFIYLRQYYLKTSRAVKRLEATARSPLFSHVSATLQGLHTIRAFRMQQSFTTQFNSFQDVHSSVWFLFLTTSRWLAVRLDLICALFIAVVAFCSLWTTTVLSGGLVGLTLTYAISLLGLFQWMVRQSAEVENQMTSVERVYEYTKLPSEAALDSSPDNKPPPNWPSEGVILAEDASFRYTDDGPWVLHNLNFHINAKEKVGIVGRTGAGKSSIIAMLFRLAEPDGVLRIDGVSTRRLGLHDLRKNIAIIPQDPVLFSASVRHNIDTFNEHTDNTLWAVLQEVRMKNFIEDLPQRLEHRVSEGGVNFSVGQRQLICLARAILRHCRILVVDEATANVDLRTDALIQQTIREKFRHCTVLTIAHRLNTIMDSDRIMVLSEGQIIAFDKPLTLLENTDSPLSKMVAEVGAEESKRLLAIASGTAAPYGRLATTSISSVEDNQISIDTPKHATTYDSIGSANSENATGGGVDGADVAVTIDEDVTETSTLLSNPVSPTTEYPPQTANSANNVSPKHVNSGKAAESAVSSPVIINGSVSNNNTANT